jgi:hypothetical protein
MEARMKLKSTLVLGMLVLLSACSDATEDPDVNPADGVGTETTPGTSGDADLATVQDYELTMEGIDKYYAAMRNVALAMKDMTPAEREQHEAALDAEDIADLDDMAARLEDDPIFSEAIEEAGLSTREYAVLTMSLVQSGMAAAVIGMQPNADPDSLARAMQANPDNIRFLQEHGDELEAKQQAMEEEMERLGIPQE